MKSTVRILVAVLLFLTTSVISQAQVTREKVVDGGGSGPYKAIAAAEKTLPTHTVYRPRDLDAAFRQEGKLPIIVFANGGCSDSSITHEKVLSEIASHGYVVIAIGALKMTSGERRGGRTEATMLTDAIDWIAAQNSDESSSYHERVDLSKIASGGQSCGGAQILAVAADSRIKTYMMFNSGMGEMSMAGASKESLSDLHGPIVYIVGGPSDVATSNAEKDYQNIADVPVAFANLLEGGHMGTFAEEHGGSFSRIALAWLDWQLKGQDQNAAIFLADEPPEGFPGWTRKAKNFKVSLQEDGDSDEITVPQETAYHEGDSDARNLEMATPAGFQTIHNDFYWTDQNGDRILTRSGCLCRFDKLYYWYGGNQRGFREQYCYTSPDLVNWTNHGVVLRHDVDANRIDVLRNPRTGQYVMFMKYDGNGAHFSIATADTPEGPFTFQEQTLVDEALMGDMSVFQDDDGKAYLCYVSWAVGTNAQHGIYLLSPDYLKLEKRIHLWDIGSREAPHIFKRNGIYYYGTSLTDWIASSGTKYYKATDIVGPWSPAEPLETPGSENSWDTQVDFVFPIKGTKGTVYMFAGDRWTKDLPTGRNGDYVWLPMEFDGDKPIVNYYQDWDIDLRKGTWRPFDPERNLALGKTATASSESGDHTAQSVLQSTSWRDYNQSYWQSDVDDNQWIRVDLGAPMEMDRVILKWNVNAAKDFKIQTSTDGQNWSDVYSTTQGSSGTVTDVSFDQKTARYVQMVATAPAPVRSRGRGFGRRGRGAATPAPSGYSLFQFMVLND
ncbi:family 43 glycosylhydrolase [Aeoliella sp. ICT_H6.2]|uniref:Family 43 glycosylhydrolase n=1 Tax=Aeoliella straminimaris TaxID=2954799 RepID=A0A9X2JGY1_9BACT|nr:family 43 glycosylhydrolase [Aeoliella straminimaris]MCO6044038.1 family 43 glycosylhydrolase [Aeoliella straminimaris]